jgi:hypothetical protein
MTPPSVEVLVDDQHRRPEVARSDRGRKPHAPGARHDHVDFVVPLDVGRRALGSSRPQSGCDGGADTGHRPLLEELAPAEDLPLLRIRVRSLGVTLLAHLHS